MAPMRSTDLATSVADRSSIALATMTRSRWISRILTRAQLASPTPRILLKEPVLRQEPQADRVQDRLGLVEIHGLASADPQPVIRDEPAVRTHLDIAHVLSVLAAQVVEDVLGIGQTCRWRGTHACQATGLVNASISVQACRFC